MKMVDVGQNLALLPYLSHVASIVQVIVAQGAALPVSLGLPKSTNSQQSCSLSYPFYIGRTGRTGRAKGEKVRSYNCPTFSLTFRKVGQVGQCIQMGFAG